MLRDLAAVNIGFGLVAFTWLLLRTSGRWSEYPREMQKVILFLIAVFFGLLISSIEIYLSPGVVQPTTVFIVTGVKVFALYVLATTGHTKYRTGPRDPDRDHINPNEDV
jgi:hypothetical protein